MFIETGSSGGMGRLDGLANWLYSSVFVHYQCPPHSLTLQMHFESAQFLRALLVVVVAALATWVCTPLGVWDGQRHENELRLAA